MLCLLNDVLAKSFGGFWSSVLFHRIKRTHDFKAVNLQDKRKIDDALSPFIGFIAVRVAVCATYCSTNGSEAWQKKPYDRFASALVRHTMLDPDLWN